MDFNRNSSAVRREELLRLVEHSLPQLSDSELEAVYYDLLTKGYIR